MPGNKNNQPDTVSSEWSVDLSERSSASGQKILDAERFAAKCHQGQWRQSGEPFISHPRAVAEICLQLNLDSDAVCAALLHDTVEDTGAQLKEIEQQFGPEVAALVDGVTKISGLNFRSGDQRQAENYRKMIVAMSRDIRVVLIKLADRLHNMRTIKAVPRKKQQLKAGETLEIYAPLAHRLGINKLKSELEDLAFATLHPRKYQEIKTLVGRQLQERQDLVQRARDELQTALDQAGITAEIAGRPKHFYSIYCKMAYKGREFNEIFDLNALRLIVNSHADCYAAVGIIHELWPALPGRYKDYISVPKANGYQALHSTVLGPEGRPLEVQIRSQEMHHQAEYGVAAHVNYKEGRNDLQLPWLTNLAQKQTEQGAEEFLSALKGDLLEDEVYVFTPDGDIKRLPAGATPIDFAYAVHTAVGHRCTGAKVNGRLVPLHYKLRSGEIIEIITANSSAGPSRDWLNLARSSKARSKIRSWFRGQNTQQDEQYGRQLLLSELRSRQLPASGPEYQEIINQLVKEQGVNDQQELFTALGQKKLAINSIMASLLDYRRPAASEQTVNKDKKRSRVVDQPGIVVNGQENVAVRLANCCHPAPGDQLVGYISIGRGVTVHRQECVNISRLKEIPERLVEVSWEHHGHQPLRVKIEVSGINRRGLLEDISRVLAENGADVISASCFTDQPLASNHFVIDIGDLPQLQRCLQVLAELPDVSVARRL